jgi:hypothetical protein
MTSMEYAADVARLARAVEFYWDETPEFPPSDQSGVYVLDLHIRTSRLRQLVAVQQALELALDAAQIAVLHREWLYSDNDEAIAEILDNPDVVFNLIWAGPGSLRLALLIDPLSPDGRENVRAIFFVLLGALNLMPGGQPLALAFGAALEGILALGRWAEKDWARRTAKATVPLQTVDEVSLQGARVDVGITPPGTAWVPPT